MTAAPMPDLPITIIFESARFVVAGSEAVRPIDWSFEVIRTDCTPQRSTYLHGEAARPLIMKILEWRDDIPSLSEVEQTLDRWSQLGTVPLTWN